MTFGPTLFRGFVLVLCFWVLFLLLSENSTIWSDILICFYERDSNWFSMVTEWQLQPIAAAVRRRPSRLSASCLSALPPAASRLPPSLPAEGPPPAAGTEPALQEQTFSCCWVTGQDRRCVSREPGKGALRPAAHFSTRLPSLPAETPRAGAGGEWAFSFERGLDYSVSFSPPVSLNALVASHLSRPQAFIEPLFQAR